MDSKWQVTGRDLLRLGIPEGRGIGEGLEFAREEVRMGRSWDDLAPTLLEKYGKRPTPDSLMGLQRELSVEVAASPEGDEEERNIAASLDRMRELTRVPVVKKAALMPDTCPSGNEWGAIPVGGVVVTSNSVIPGAHSADVNCGMCATLFDSRSTLRGIMDALRGSTHFGSFPVPAGLENSSDVLGENVWSNPFLRGLEGEALRALGTQGDGNHFSYVGEVEVSRGLVGRLEASGHGEIAREIEPYQGRRLWTLVTHHGSRNFGAKVYRRGLEAAGRYTNTVATGIPKNCAWLDLGTSEGQDYWNALEYVGRWTLENHQVIHRKLLLKLGVSGIATLANHHNAVWRRDDGIYHGKGATPAWKDGGVSKIGIIPLNMGREILLVEGGDNARYLSFAPHGAGRNRSRTATKQRFLDPETGELDPDRVREAIDEQTSGIEVTWASGRPDISESPLGYKCASKVREEIEKFGLAKTLAEVQPRGCIMAGEFGGRAGRRGRGGLASALREGLRGPGAVFSKSSADRRFHRDLGGHG